MRVANRDENLQLDSDRASTPQKNYAALINNGDLDRIVRISKTDLGMKRLLSTKHKVLKNGN